jgi:hypothetical protein
MCDAACSTGSSRLSIYFFLDASPSSVVSCGGCLLTNSNFTIVSVRTSGLLNLL